MSYRILFLSAVFVVLGALVCFAVGPFTGSWDVTVGLAPQNQTMPFTTFESTLNLGFCVAFLELWSVSDFIFSGWLWQEIGLSAGLGFLSFDGLMLLKPQNGAFLYAEGVLGFDFSLLALEFRGAAVGPSVAGGMNSGLVFSLFAELPGGIASLESTTYLGADLSGISFVQTSPTTTSPLLTKTYATDPTAMPNTCGYCFSGQRFTFATEFLGCIGFTSITDFNQFGFESEEIELTFQHLFGLPLNITLEYHFSTQTASHVFIPSIETDFGCVRIYADVLGSGTTITGLDIYGISFEASFAGATFRSISNFNTTANVITTPAFGSVVEPKATADDEGHLYYPQSYWEVVSLTMEMPVSIGEITFSVNTFFGQSTGLLFDWAETEISVAVNIGGYLTLSSAMAVDMTGFTEWRLGTSLAW